LDQTSGYPDEDLAHARGFESVWPCVKRSGVSPAAEWTWSRRRSRACCAGVR
jgi:hypothetical protein